MSLCSLSIVNAVALRHQLEPASFCYIARHLILAKFVAFSLSFLSLFFFISGIKASEEQSVLSFTCWATGNHQKCISTVDKFAFSVSPVVGQVDRWTGVGHSSLTYSIGLRSSDSLMQPTPWGALL